MAALTGQVTFTPEEIATFPQGPKGDPGSGSGGGYLPQHLVRFVDFQNGLDASSGLDPGAAKKNLQVAYDELKAGQTAGEGVGRIVLLPGDHDIGSGFVIDQRWPVEIEGFRHGRGYGTSAKASRIVSSSASATELVLTGSLSAVTYGNRFVGVSFIVKPENTALTACIRARANTYLNVERCFAAVSSGPPRDVPLLEQHPGGTSQDNAWLRLLNNTTSGLPLYHAGGGGNFNRSLIGWNVVQFGLGGSLPMIWLEGNFWSGTVIGNNLEGGKSGPHVKLGSASWSADNNLFLNNSGEASGADFPFYHVVRGGFNQFIGGWCTAGDAIGTWIQFDATSFATNIVHKDVSIAGTAGYKRKIVDNSAKKNTVIDPRFGQWQKYKSGPAPTISDADWQAPPPDGQIAVTHRATDNERRIWVRANGGWVSMVGS